MENNDAIIEAWNTILFEKFCRYKHLLLDGLGQHGSRLFEEYPPRSGWRVVDIGCGFGDSTARIADLVGESGKAVGIDCASNFIEAAQDYLPTREGRLEFKVKDVQSDDLEGPYDAAYSRFGTMFFSAPVAALRNVRKSLKPGASLHMSVWRKREDNPCFYAAQQAVETVIDRAEMADDQVTCGPGPFSMAGPDMVSDQLMAAGFEAPQFQRYDAPMCIGTSIEEALAFARDVGPAGEMIRLAATAAAERYSAIEDAVREACRPYLTDNGVWATSSTWLVTARVPRG